MVANVSRQPTETLVPRLDFSGEVKPHLSQQIHLDLAKLVPRIENFLISDPGKENRSSHPSVQDRDNLRMRVSVVTGMKLFTIASLP